MDGSLIEIDCRNVFFLLQTQPSFSSIFPRFFYREKKVSDFMEENKRLKLIFLLIFL